MKVKGILRVFLVHSWAALFYHHYRLILTPNPNKNSQMYYKRGDESLWTEDFSRRHTSMYRLTDRGRNQARVAGTFIKENIASRFDRYFVSEYIRAMETAVEMDFTDARWTVDFFLREQDRGVLGSKSHATRKDSFKELTERRKRDPFYVAPPGGESMANTCIRVDEVLNAIKSTCTGLKALVVCHGNIMMGFRVRLEGWTQSMYRECMIMKNHNPKYR